MMVGHCIIGGCSKFGVMAYRFFMRDCRRMNRARGEHESKNQSGEQFCHKLLLSRCGYFGQTLRHSSIARPSRTRQKSHGIGNDADALTFSRRISPAERRPAVKRRRSTKYVSL